MSYKKSNLIVYKCNFPGCIYKTTKKSQIANHHIIPKSLNGSDRKFNRVYLCPNCHSKIYIENIKTGIHSVKSEDSIIIKGWIQSTTGTLLEYTNSDNSITKYIIRLN